MTYRALRPSRRRVAALLAALALIVSAAAPAPTPQNRSYYSTAAKTNLVGQGRWTCQFTYVQLWGVATAYYTYSLINCDVDPAKR